MRIVCIADLQSQFNNIDLKTMPQGDILLVAGDLTSWGSDQELMRYDEWLALLPYPRVITIAGNHDLGLEGRDAPRTRKVFTHTEYLQDSGVDIPNEDWHTKRKDVIKIWGSPVNLTNIPTVFKGFTSNTKTRLDKIPTDTDILITHGGPYGILDRLTSGQNIGDPDILVKVGQLKPKLHLFGHIHEAYGWKKTKDTLFVNAAICNEYNEVANLPVVVDTDTWEVIGPKFL
jgi:Icc-related predicted phosphoesterase